MSSETAMISLYGSLLLMEMYLIVKLHSFIDMGVYLKYRLLGPFSLLVPGVLKPGGSKYLLATAIGAIALFGVGVYVFEMGDLVLG